MRPGLRFVGCLANSAMRRFAEGQTSSCARRNTRVPRIRLVRVVLWQFALRDRSALARTIAKVAHRHCNAIGGRLAGLVVVLGRERGIAAGNERGEEENDGRRVFEQIRESRHGCCIARQRCRYIQLSWWMLLDSERVPLTIVVDAAGLGASASYHCGGCCWIRSECLLPSW